jgi:hypothetical protein
MGVMRERCVSDQDSVTDVEQLRARQAQTDHSLVALANALEIIAEQVRADPTTEQIERMRFSAVRLVTAAVRQNHQAPTEETVS